MIQMGIRSKLLLIISVIVLVVVWVHTYLQVSMQEAAFHNELEKRNVLMKSQLFGQASTEVRLIKRTTEEGLASYNLFGLIDELRRAVSRTPALTRIVLIDNKALALIDTQEVGGQQGKPFAGLGYDPADVNSGRFEDHEIQRVKEGDAVTAVIFDEQIRVGSAPWGRILFVYSLEALNHSLSVAHEEMRENLRELTHRAFYLAGALIAIAALVIFRLSKTLVSPIVALSRATRQVAQGEFEAIHKIQPGSPDEVGVLNRNFVEMGHKLQASYQELEAYSHSLENMVEERTESLRIKNDALTQAMSDLEASQHQLIQAEKMAALGQLISGIAHEINTPLGAIQASIGNTSKDYQDFIARFQSFIPKASAEAMNVCCGLVKNTRRELVLNTREERKLRRELAMELEAYGVEDPSDMAQALIDMGCRVSDALVQQGLQMPEWNEILVVARSLVDIDRNSEMIQIAVNRAAKVVFALKYFAHQDNSGHLISSDINKGIQTVLVLYQNLLRKGCQVEEHYGALPEVLCYQDALNQVWTNLIHNALYAMQNEGRLEIETRMDGEMILVSITDSGAGIPEDVKPRIFESFFTTKPAGEGSGLGLGICKRIVEKHQGTLSFTSVPGRTTFVVRLPVKPVPFPEE